MKQYTLREFLCANTFITLHRLFPEETGEYRVASYWSAITPTWREAPIEGFGLDDMASWSEWERRLAA